MYATVNNNKGPNLYEECAKGNFEKTLLYIKKNLDGRINNKIAISFFTNCCQACIHHKNNVSEEDLYAILISLLPILNNLEENEISNYVKCLYHFVKFFCSKGKKEIIIKMEDIIMPKFLLPKDMQNHIDLYYYITTLLHNLVANSAVTVFDEVSYKICSLILKICTTCFDTIKTIQVSSNCFTILTGMDVPVNYMMDFYQKLLECLAKHSINNEKSVIRLVLKFSYEIFYLYTSSHDFEKAELFIAVSHDKFKNMSNISEYLELLEVLKVFVIYSPLQKKDSDLEIKKYIETLKVFKTRVNYKKDFVDYLGKILRTSIDYYSNINSAEWLSLPENIQLQYFRFFSEYNSLLISLVSQDDPCKNIYASIKYSQYILQLMKSTIKNKEVSLEYHQSCIELLKTFLNEIVVLKKHNVDTWKLAWNSLSLTIYNIGIHLGYHTEKSLNQVALKYLYVLLKYILVLEGNSEELIIKYEALESTFITIIDVHANDVKQQLSFISLAILLCKRSRKTFVRKWIDLKYSLRENPENTEDMKAVTLLSALDAIQNILPDLKLDNSDKIFMLNFELEFYKQRWKSVVPMMSTINHLRQISSTDCYINAIVKLFVDIGLLKHEDFHNIVGNALESCINTQDGTINSAINLGILYFAYYKSSHKEIIKKNAKDMERVASIEPLTNDFDPTDPTNSNNEFDILSSYESLNLEVFKDIFNNLEHSLEVFTSFITKLTTDLEHVTIIQMFNVLLEMSLEFRLLCFNVKSVQALELALCLAQLLNIAPSIIKSIGLILEQTDTKNYLMEIADKLIEDETFSKSDNLEVSIMYYISKSRVLLYEDMKKSHENYMKAKELFEQVQDNNSFAVMKCQLLLLASKFSMLPCNLRVEPHSNSLLINAYSAAEVILEEYKNIPVGDSSVLLMLIQAKKELVELNYFLKCPREVRHYGKDILVLMQKLVLPLHTVSYLLYLAHADLCLENQDSCYVKVKDIATILNIKSKSGRKKLYKRYSPSSPSFAEESCEAPCTMKHESTCDCYYCACYEYQYLVLEKARLSALINVKDNNLAAAQDVFQSALDLYDNYVKKYSRNRHQVPDFLPSYGYLLLNYSSHLWRSKNKPEAFNWNRTLLSLLASKKLQYIHLYSEALVQKLGYLTVNIIPEPTPTLKEQMERLQVSSEVVLPKTPENRQSQVSIMVDRSNLESAQKLQVVKRLPFSFASPEPPKNKPVKVIEKTPAPKIQIYTESSEKKTRRKAVSKVPPVLTFSESIPDSTQTALSSALKSRTKLLTAKIKQTSKIPDAFEGEEVAIVSTRSQARKNLLKEMSAPDPDTKTRGTGAVRKTRKK
ncbi:uncharacterized protein [Diabrotica undecimpunctata]|uniref:uncharacterized protein isoform X2 n=1 Tax=Diabrotica undecimpunctata TaxID=50387 RepID=UPI003B632DF6